MIAGVAFATLILVIRGTPVVFDFMQKLARQKNRRLPLKALPPPRHAYRARR